MTTLAYIIVFSLVGSVVSLVGGFVLLANERLAKRLSHALAAFAAGALLGTAFLDLIPEALEGSDEAMPMLLWVVVGVVLFFILERFIHWFHPHHEHLDAHEHESKLTVSLLLIGDTVHNFIDGVVIGATFLVDIRLGVLTSLAVAAHEIPQEIGDVAIMLHRGVPRRKIILYNILSALAALVGALLVYVAGTALDGMLPVFLALTAGFFIYIAASDLMPELHHVHNRRAVVIDSLLLIAGIAVVWAGVTYFHPQHAETETHLEEVEAR